MIKQLLILLLALVINTGLSAQPFNLKKEIKPTELKLINFNPKDAKKKGRINLTQVVQVKDTAYYFVKKLSIYSPIVVSVAAADPANPVEVSLHKWNWKTESRPGKSTNDKGYWEEKFSTESDFGIMVVAPQKPVSYNIYVWVGDEVKIDMATPFKPYTGSSSNLLSKKNIFMAIGLLLAMVAAWFFIKRKKINKTAVLFMLLLISSPSFAQLDGLFDGVDGSGGSAPLNPNDFGSGTIIQNSPGTSGSPSTSMSEDLEGPDPDDPTSFSNRMARDHETISNISGAITNGVNIITAGGALWEAFKILDAGECTPDFTQPANALIPSSCSATSGCNDCYKAALDGFNADRKTLARMMCIFMNNKNFTDKAIAFGNSMASLPGGVGLGWIPAKKMIDNAFTNLKNTYDKKSRELLISLQKNMMKIDQCENSFGLKDWYQRFGFMYFEFMQQKYKRPE
jgi:hypothetical protein